MNYYKEIKENLINNEVYKKVKDYSKNRSDLDTYYKVGELLSKAGKHYGEGIIKEYSKKLLIEYNKKYNERTLRRYRQFYLTLSNLNWSTWYPNPIIIKNPSNKEIINEKLLHLLILEDISSFMKELGNGFCYIDSEYKIKIGSTYNYIDLLLYNINYNCYVVIELKVTELKKRVYWSNRNIYELYRY